MTRYFVTTAITAYTRYEVEAATEEEARALVAGNAKRGELPYVLDGHGDDEDVIAVRRADA